MHSPHALPGMYVGRLVPPCMRPKPFQPQNRGGSSPACLLPTAPSPDPNGSTLLVVLPCAPSLIVAPPSPALMHVLRLVPGAGGGKKGASEEVRGARGIRCCCGGCGAPRARHARPHVPLLQWRRRSLLLPGATPWRLPRCPCAPSVVRSICVA